YFDLNSSVATCGWKSSGSSTVRTTNTSQGEWRTMASDTEPTMNRSTALRPEVPHIIKSASTSAANFLGIIAFGDSNSKRVSASGTPRVVATLLEPFNRASEKFVDFLVHA